MCNKYPGPRCDNAALTTIIKNIGMQEGSPDAELEARCELVGTRGGLIGLAEQIKTTTDPDKKEVLLSVYKTGLINYEKKMKLIGIKAGKIPGRPNLDGVLAEHNPLVISHIAYGLYGRAPSPLYEKALSIRLKTMGAIPGYAPGEGNTTILSTQNSARSMSANLTGLPDNITAYDIETDTSNGFGLEPRAAQITEMVLSNKYETVVLAGDEKHILQGMADYMNSRPNGEVMVGWNSGGFDDPFIAHRAELHQDNLVGWNMHLQSNDDVGTHPIVGGHDKRQEFTWTKPNGGQHNSIDAMIEMKKSGLRNGQSMSLKPSVRATGMSPIELDRANLHKYSQREREDYVASDGIATLHALLKARHIT